MSRIKEHYAELIENGLLDPKENADPEQEIDPGYDIEEDEDDWIEPEDDDSIPDFEEPPADLFAP